ncbi:MAG TPA: hypothetical protein VI981_03130 [Candidatus Paceibacterota bacterium]
MTKNQIIGVVAVVAVVVGAFFFGTYSSNKASRDGETDYDVALDKAASIVSASLDAVRSEASAKAHDARRITDLKQLELALELYYGSNESYPLSIGRGTIGSLAGAGYISNVPTDPVSNVTYIYAPLAKAGAATAAAICSSTQPCVSYVLLATLENSNTIPNTSIKTNPLGGQNCRTTGVYCVVP